MDTIELLKRLVEVDTSNPQGVEKAIRFASDYMSEHNIKGELIESNGLLSYVCQIGKGEKTLILNGHLDVVAGEKTMFIATEKDGKLFGRGTADMKAGCACMMNAMIRLNKENLAHKIMMQLVPDEESGGFEGTKQLVKQGYVGDFVIVGEPTNLKISLQSKGFIRLKIDVTGESAHSCRPWEGVNAIEKAFKLYEAISHLDFMHFASDHYKGSTLNLAKISGGDAFNKVPSNCLLWIDIRYVPGLSPDEIIKQIRSIADDIQVVMIGEDLNTSMDDQNVVKLDGVISKIKAIKAEYTYQHGSSDARFFSILGIPSIEFGPSGNHWHGDKEYVEIKSISDYEEILVEYGRKF